MRVTKPKSFIEECIAQTRKLLTALSSTNFPAKAILIDEIQREGVGDADECLHKVSYTLLDSRNKQLFSSSAYPLLDRENIAANWLETIYLGILKDPSVPKVRCTFVQHGGELVINLKRQS